MDVTAAISIQTGANGMSHPIEPGFPTFEHAMPQQQRQIANIEGNVLPGRQCIHGVEEERSHKRETESGCVNIGVHRVSYRVSSRKCYARAAGKQC